MREKLLGDLEKKQIGFFEEKERKNKAISGIGIVRTKNQWKALHFF